MTAVTGLHLVLNTDYEPAAGKEHCFTWIQVYYTKEVVVPVTKAIAYGKKKYFEAREE